MDNIAGIAVIATGGSIIIFALGVTVGICYEIWRRNDAKLNKRKKGGQE